MLAYLVMRIVYIPWKARRVFRQQKSYHCSFELCWYDAGFAARDSNGQYTTPWSDFIKWQEHGRLFLLYHSDLLFHMVPKRAFPSENSLSEPRSRVQKNIVT